MKTSFISKSLLLLTSIVILGFVTGCNKSETDPKYQIGEYVKHVDDLTAVIHFNADLDEWYLSYSIPSSLDSVHDFYPGTLDKTYQQEDMKVVFSGEVYQMDYKSITSTTESFKIVLSTIREWTENDDKLGYWRKDKFIEFQIADPNVFLVQPRLNDSPISAEKMKEFFPSIGVEAIISGGGYKDRFIVSALELPQHQDMFVSPQYKISNVDWLYVLPQINFKLASEEALDAILQKYGERLTQATPLTDGSTIHRYNCDFSTAEEVLRLATKIHFEPSVIWCEPNMMAPIIFD